MAFRQCPKRVWLEVHRPELRADSAQTQASFEVGHTVGELARDLYDPAGAGHFIDIDALGFPGVFDATREALGLRKPIFEAAFSSDDALALADVLLPARRGAWTMVEVKSSTSVKDVYRDDVAVQALVAQKAGVKIDRVALAHIDSSWVYPGGGDYRGLLVEEDLTRETLGRNHEAQSWIAAARAIVARSSPPQITTGSQCDAPYECGFLGHCASREPQAEWPVQWLPHFRASDWIARGVRDMREVPDAALNDKQKRVRHCTVEDQVYFDRAGAQAALAPHPLPGYFLDFETISFAVPIWAGTRPYQQIPFQYSLHRLGPRGALQHREFLDLTGQDPSRALAEQLVSDCGDTGPVFAYSAGFEKSRISELAARFADLHKQLLAINERMVDLLPVARNHFYHPSQQGSWSIKAVLPAAVPGLDYQQLEGVQHGGDAQDAFTEAIHPETTSERKTQLRQQLLTYCHLDTYAMVRLWQLFAGRTEWSL